MRYARRKEGVPPRPKSKSIRVGGYEGEQERLECQIRMNTTTKKRSRGARCTGEVMRESNNRFCSTLAEMLELFDTDKKNQRLLNRRVELLSRMWLRKGGCDQINGGWLQLRDALAKKRLKVLPITPA